jgi:glycerophosphoryl diester phosphodiesterase
VRNDPIFGLRVPLVFAHRGGAGEVPESTEAAFRHAVSVGADVLEFDLSLTRDNQIVLWHGPELDNVYIGSRLLEGLDIDKVDWTELGSARVVHPKLPPERSSDPARRLLLLEEFVALVKSIESERGLLAKIPWNIEIKGQRERWKAKFPELFAILNSEAAQRKIVLAAQRRKLSNPLRDAASQYPGVYALNVCLEDQLAYKKLMRRGLLERVILAGLDVGYSSQRKASLLGQAFQTSYRLVSEELVKEVHARDGAVHAFLSGFGPLKGVEEKADA